MSDSIQVTYDGVVIVYDEQQNVFAFELRGRCRTAQSLAKAKEMIDKPVSEKVKPFTRINAYHRTYGDAWEIGQVTSVAEDRHYATYVWFVCGNKRSKERQENLYPVTDKNTAIVDECKNLTQQIATLSEKRRKLSDTMKCLVVEKEEA